MHSLWRLPQHRYACQLESSRQLASTGNTSYLLLVCTDVSIQIVTLLSTHLKVDTYIPLRCIKMGRIIRHDSTRLQTRQAWITLPLALGTVDKDGLSQGSSLASYRGRIHYMTEIYRCSPSYGLRCAIGQIKALSHQLRIQAGEI